MFETRPEASRGARKFEIRIQDVRNCPIGWIHMQFGSHLEFAETVYLYRSERSIFH